MSENVGNAEFELNEVARVRLNWVLHSVTQFGNSFRGSRQRRVDLNLQVPKDSHYRSVEELGTFSKDLRAVLSHFQNVIHLDVTGEYCQNTVLDAASLHAPRLTNLTLGPMRDQIEQSQDSHLETPGNFLTIDLCKEKEMIAYQALSNDMVEIALWRWAKSRNFLQYLSLPRGPERILNALMDNSRHLSRKMEHFPFPVGGKMIRMGKRGAPQRQIFR
ncbi:hypothetical protein DFJ77DRAFT_438461 [Powellomyces hirtus]|nr:hypothetical protein DFJ77DRAFT_438461 [Powellomyces hirtus]